MSRIGSLVLVLGLSVGAAACGTTEAAPAPTAKAQPATAAAEAQTTCVEVFTRNRTCTDDYIPALVDARARHDKPPGIAEAVKADRNAVIAEAKGEWADDSKDEAIAQTCQKMTEQIDRVEPGDLEAARGCLAKADCASFVACVTPIFEKQFSK